MKPKLSLGGYFLRKLFVNVHPFLFTLNSLLYLYLRNRWETPPSEILRPLFVLWILVLILYPLARKIAGSNEWSAILLTKFVFGFFSEQTYFILVTVYASVVFFALFTCLVLRKQPFQLFYLSFCLTLISFTLLIAQSMISLSSLHSVPQSYYEAMQSRAKRVSFQISEPTSGIKPDIYYIILDGYSGADVLQDFYGYDNSAFLGFLQDRGFIIPQTVLSNYPRTALSISSTLDMQYWDSISPKLNDVIFWWPTKPVLNHSRVRQSLESIGYQSVSIASDWEITNNTTTDYYFKPFPLILNQYEDSIITSTPLKLLQKPFQSVAPVRTSEVHRRFILYSLETLTKIPEMQGPKFVFAHIIIPHPPFVFKADGSPVVSRGGFTFGSPTGLSEEEYRRAYIEQIEYVNSQLRSVVETIIDKSATPPIVLLQADHGLGLSVSFNSTENDCLKERFSAFGAYYLPGKPQDLIPQEFTPVNLFRIVLNEYFGANLGLLDNRQFFTTGHNLFAGLQEVTQQVQNKCVMPVEGE